MSLASFNYSLLNMFRMLIHPSSGACDLFVELFLWVVLLWFDVCWCYVVVWLGWCGIRMQAEALHTDTTSFEGLTRRIQFCVGTQCHQNVDPDPTDNSLLDPFDRKRNKSLTR